jgi:60S ribosome subunit biogenesis protein NIP7
MPVFKKMAEYTGASLKDIIVGSNSPKADRNVFRVSQQRVYLVRDSIAKFATSVSRDKLLSLGACLLANRKPDFAIATVTT